MTTTEIEIAKAMEFAIYKHGDQKYGDLGLMLMGLGEILGIWNLLTPSKLSSMLPQDLRMQMAGMGMVSIQAKKEEEGFILECAWCKMKFRQMDDDFSKYPFLEGHTWDNGLICEKGEVT